MIERDLKAQELSTGWVSVIRFGYGERWIAEAHKEGERHQAEADTLMTAFIELRKSIQRLHNL